MKKYIRPWILLVFAAAMFLSGCSGAMYAANNWPGLTASDDTVYVANGGSIFAVRTGDGALIWQFPEKSSNRLAFYASPVIDNDQLIVGDFTNSLHGIDLKTGTQRWVFDESKNRYIAEVLVENGNIFAPSTDHFLYALDSQQNVMWKFETGQALWAKPVGSGDIIYQASLDHHLYALKAQTGEQIWNTDLGGAAGYSPALNGEGKLFIGTLANEMLALNKENGQIEWRFPSKAAVWATPLLHEGVLYFGDIQGNFYSVDSLNGNLKWSLENAGEIVGSPVAIPDGVVYCTSAGEIIAVKTTGEKIWTKIETGEIYSTPGIAGDKLVVALTKGEVLLKAYSLAGAELWSFSIPN